MDKLSVEIEIRQRTAKFCVIAPTAYLEQYATQSDVHLCLAHLVDKDAVYASFYKRMAERGDLVIMDNSAYELLTPYSPGKLIELGRKCGAGTVVLPDYPFKSSSLTVDAAKEFIPQFKDAGFGTFFVPQSLKGDVESWIESYEWASENKDIDMIGMSCIGIPGALPHIPSQYARTVMVAMLRERGIYNESKHHHYLGLNGAPNLELAALIRMNAVDTCDSSNPVWNGINGNKYDTTLVDFAGKQKKYLRHVNFDEPLVKSHLQDIIQHNLDVTFDIFENPSRYVQ